MSPVRLGIRANLGQFSILVLVNAFVGAMIGVERTVLPLLARQEFQLASKAAAVSFLVSFGLAKALGNLAAGRMADRWGRKSVLITGWLVGLPAPLMIVYAPGWLWVIAANVLLGINQALCWSVTVIMKIDLAGPERRGMATAANEWAGYAGIALVAFVTGHLASVYSPRPYPFYLGAAIALAGLFLSLVFVRGTKAHVRHEETSAGVPSNENRPQESTSFGRILWQSTWQNRSLRAASQAGLATNLKDGLVWGLTPVLLSSHGVSIREIGIVAAVYPAVWGFTQLATGPLSDRWGRKWLILGGMAIQALGVALFAAGGSLWHWIAAAAITGFGTAAVYPTLQALVSDVAEPSWRASSLGVYRLWRDAGYVLAGAVVGPLADATSVRFAFSAVAALVLASGILVVLWMRETHHATALPANVA